MHYKEINIKLNLTTPTFYSKLICTYIYNYNHKVTVKIWITINFLHKKNSKFVCEVYIN